MPGKASAEMMRPTLKALNNFPVSLCLVPFIAGSQVTGISSIDSLSSRDEFHYLSCLEFLSKTALQDGMEVQVWRVNSTAHDHLWYMRI